MARHLSRQLVNTDDDAPIERFFPHGPSGLVSPAPSTPRHNSNNQTPIAPCCSGGGHHGCGCGCPGCWCRLRMHFKDEANREVYGGQGGRGHGYRSGMPSPGIGGLDRASSSSFESSSPHSSSNGSFDNSFEASAPLDGHHPAAAAAVSAAAASVNTHDAQLILEPDEDGPHPWHSFVERRTASSSLDHIGDSSGMIVPGLNDDSALTRGSRSSVADRSTLSSQYEPSFMPQQNSATASQIVAQAGAAFDEVPASSSSLHVDSCASPPID
ncbi:uncharacterized protein Z520_06953 [Fonsecaea multimorphosa CBS 102226]|uniref:Uncharacterized protein n=1 Tax=Fonsecaea multimorphosa CBS 102226 TaxID=1442371 RepID=A0A0D2IKE8_9EURO|nr:uncharacterized protein Z520_06953 [Fonsecaea multimorphosa CBS 102226]KIX97501.1 hypothetical protein Z520_06953 [Fonsecaea multimorphosa CBS 102226]OAL23463.1 hypothetical protein AYO22_06513 [Fonsecaea multimorphosa]